MVKQLIPLALLAACIAFQTAEKRSVEISGFPGEKTPDLLASFGLQSRTMAGREGAWHVRDGRNRFSLVAGLHSRPDAYLQFFEAEADFHVGRVISKQAVADWTQRSGAPGDGTVDASIDGSVVITKRIQVDGQTRAAVAKALDDFEARMNAVRRVLLRDGPILSEERDYLGGRVDGSVRVTSLEGRDVRFLLRQWGFESHEPSMMFQAGSPEAAPGTFPIFAKASGAPFMIFAPSELFRTENTGKIELQVVGTPQPKKSLDGITWADAQEESPGWWLIRKIIDLREGMTLDQVKAQIEEFAKDVDDLHLDLSPPRQNGAPPPR
ncbi:MAG TPA: hypothetical protein VMI31_16400 [Fimbriimonadaceae bacterium]|nr:hypothetical protein [Fimbriimonadaceae bacterium]